jgi:hypothetical protein
MHQKGRRFSHLQHAFSALPYQITEILIQGFLPLNVRLPTHKGFLHTRIRLPTLKGFLHTRIRVPTLPIQGFLHLKIKLPTLPTQGFQRLRRDYLQEYIFCRVLLHAPEDQITFSSYRRLPATEDQITYRSTFFTGLYCT